MLTQSCRRKHAAEHAEQERKKAERAARKERERTLREETTRTEKEEAERRRLRRREKEYKMAVEARERYETLWKDLLAGKVDRELRVQDVPWPVLVTDISVDTLSVEAVSSFLLSDSRPADSDGDTKKERKDKLRETMLRFHPDKFEGRVLRRVHEADRERVRECAGKVARVVNELLAQ